MRQIWLTKGAFVIFAMVSVSLTLAVRSCFSDDDEIAESRLIARDAAKALSACCESLSPESCLPGIEAEDAWGAPMSFDLSGDALVVRSMGPDKRLDTADDLSWALTLTCD